MALTVITLALTRARGRERPGWGDRRRARLAAVGRSRRECPRRGRRRRLVFRHRVRDLVTRPPVTCAAALSRPGDRAPVGPHRRVPSS